MRHLVDFEPIGRRAEVEEGMVLLEAARRVGAAGEGGLSAPCGGAGVCGRCRVRIVEGRLSPPTPTEEEVLGRADLEDGYRLACQSVVLGPVKTEIPKESLTGHQKLQVEGLDVPIEVRPAVRRYQVPTRPSSVEYPVSFWQQVQRRLDSDHGLRQLRVDDRLLLGTPPLSDGSPVSVSVRGGTIVGVRPASHGSPPIGLAVDLGTTKVAGFLLDLESGATLASEGIMNPQIAYGEDVISRLAYAARGPDEYARIRGAVVAGLNDLLGTLLLRAEAGSDDVEEAVIVGNTAMHHLLAGLPTAQLASAPYVPATTFPMEIRAREMGLHMAPGAVVYLMPPVAGFVGGDHVAMILGSRIDEARRVTLGLDIGTNTEIVLAHGKRMLSCSCASGPAFEGAHITHGMRAVNGAISQVELSDGGLDVRYETIGGAPPLGVCGSGILDAVAELYRERVLNERGMLDRNHPRVRRRDGNGQPEYVVVPAEQSGTERPIVVTQRDIGEIQLAKAAIASGVKLLLKAAGLAEEEIEEVVVAGAFGTHLQLRSAILIGLLPHLPVERFRQVGNAAGTGARLALLSMHERARAERIARRVEHVELILEPAFQSTFARQMRFPPTEPAPLGIPR